MIENKSFKKINYTLESLVKDEYEDCTFQACIFSNTDLSSISFVDCEFIDCDLSSAKIYDTIFNEVRFTNCKLLGLAFDSANKFTLSATFKECQLDFSSFYKRKLKNQNFINCSLKNVDFTQAVLSNANFDNCNLENASFERSNLEKADFTKAYNYTINPELNNIKGAKFSNEGLLGLLQHYGIIVE